MKINNFYKFACLMVLTFNPLKLWSLDETTLSFQTQKTLIPFLRERVTESEFRGAGNLKIRYLHMSIPNPLGAIVVSPGKGEAAVKYAELLYDIQNWGYDVYVINHRSQGASGRLHKDPNMVHVLKFTDYVDDFSKLVDEIVRPKDYKKIFVLAHSMGGAIASGYVKTHPKALSGLILSAPMFEIKFGLGETFSLGFLQTMKSMGFGDTAAPGQGSDVNDVTNSEMRYNYNKEIYSLFPQHKTNTVSVNWVLQSHKFTQSLRESKTSIFDIPTILLQAQSDQIVLLNGQDTVCKYPCQIIEVIGAGHEILMEKDSIREPALQTIYNFIIQN